MDVLFTGSSDRTLRGLLAADRSADADTDWFINANNQLGVGGFFGTIRSNTWHRIAIVVDAPADQVLFYIDGVQVGTRTAVSAAIPAVDGRWALAVSSTAELFNDDDGGSASGYVNSIQLRDVALSKAQMAALGGPTAAGIPATLPPSARRPLRFAISVTGSPGQRSPRGWTRSPPISISRACAADSAYPCGCQTASKRW